MNCRDGNIFIHKLVTNPCEARVELRIFFKIYSKGEMFKLQNIAMFRKFENEGRVLRTG